MEAQRSYEELINNDAINSAKTGMQFAVDKQPDAEARLQSLAKQYSLPVDAVRLDPKAIERKSQLDAVDYESLVKTAPHTNYLLSDPNKAAIAHDDIDNLSQIEGGLKALRGPEPNALNIASGLLSNLSIAPLHSAIKVAFHDAFFDDGSTTAQVRHNDLLRKSLQQKDALDNTTPDFETDTAQGIYSGAASFMQALPGMAASVATANPLPMIASAGVQQGFPAYGKYLDRGATKSEAALGAVGEGSAEMGFEALPMGFIVKKFGKAGAGEFLTGLLAREIPSEQATTLAQDAIDTAIANPDKSWGDFVNERPDAAYQTLLATVTQGGITGAISSIAKRMTEQGKRVDSANLSAVNIEKLNQLAAASKVLARSPDTIKTFTEDALADSPVKDLYIDAQTFLQSGVAEQVAALLPDVAEQLKEALPGTEIRIPISDYLAHIAATPYAADLKDHLRLEGDDYSPAQAQSYMQTHAEELQHEIDAILTGHQHADDFRASQEAVKATVLAQLNKLNRFTATKNELDATLIATRMAVRGAQLGITPEQMYEKQTPNFAAEDISGGQAFSQSEIARQQIEQWTKDKLPGGQIVQLGSPSAILLSFGMDDLPIHLTKSVLDKAKNKHTVDPDDLLGLADAIHSPIAVFASKQGDGHLVVLTELKHADGNIIAALDLNKSRDHFEIHDIRSLHPKNTKGVLKWIEDGLLLGYEKTKGREWLERNSGSDSQRGQVNAALEGVRIYEAEKNSNTPNKGSFDESKALYQSVDETPRLAPNGKPSNLNPLQYAQVRTAAFKKWFGDWENNSEKASKVVDENGEPLVVYHGSPLSFDSFGKNSWFTTDPNDSKTYSTMAVPDQELSPQTYPVFLNLRNPKYIQHYIIKSEAEASLDKLKRDSGLIIDQGNRKHFVIKNPTQIKSATGNNGNFDGTDANILHQSKSTNLAALEQQSAITIDDAELSALSVAELRKEVVKRYEEKKLKPEKTIDGREVKFTGVGLREVKQHSADRKVLELLDKAHELIKVAIPLWSEDHTQANPSDSIRAWHYYGAKVALNGQDYFARLVVREDVNGNIYYDNDLTTVESISGHIGDASPTKSGAATVSTDERSISRWAHAVKSAHLNQPRFGSFHPPTNTIAIFKQGNLSTRV